MARKHGTDSPHNRFVIRARKHMDRQITLLAQPHLSEIKRGHCAARSSGASSTGYQRERWRSIIGAAE
jgi:hypothetical protein